MNKIKILFFLILISTSSCSLFTTRVEEDKFTITKTDTVDTYFVKNAPDNVDRGIVHPSTKVIETVNRMVQYDSIVERKYPDFIRLGLFEGVGLIGGNTDFSLSTGILGVHPDFGLLDESKRGGEGSIFAGGLYRIFIYENRLRWFQDAENWTFGFHGLEYIAHDARAEFNLMGYFTPYLRKRWFLRDDIPYLSATLSMGMSLFPSQYLNVSGSLDLGSLGGLNLRAYLGYAFCYNSESTPMITNNDFTNDGVTSSILYGGLGVSVLDFVNIVPELYTEWKDHEHSSWEVGLIQYGFLSSNSNESFFADNTDPDSDSPLFNGFLMKIANANLVLPYYNNHFYVGTSLLSMYILGQNGNGMAILPLRLGYTQQILKDELFIEPHFEYGYFPSTIYNFAVKLNLRVSNVSSVFATVGYLTGNSGGGFGDALGDFGNLLDFNTPYIGIGIGFQDRLFFPDELRYNK